MCKDTNIFGTGDFFFFLVMKMMVVVDVEMCVVCKMMGMIMTEVEGLVIVKGRGWGLALLFFEFLGMVMVGRGGCR